jgi:tetratricopeptide (TPR) repeat protein
MSDVTSADSARSAAEAAMQSEDWESAIRNWTIVRSMRPSDVAGFVRGSHALAQAGRLEDADILSEEAVKQFPENAWAAHTFAEMAARRGDWEAARKRWGAVRRNFPDDVAGYVNGAAVLMKCGSFDEAGELIRWALANHPEHPDTWIQRATLLSQRGLWSEAADAWQEVRLKFPELVVGYGAGAEALFQCARIEEAHEVGKQGTEKFSDNIWLAHVYAGLAHRCADWNAATKRWADVCSRFPDDPFGYELETISLREAGRAAEAEALLMQAKARFPSHLGVIRQLAETFMQREAWADAEKQWEELRQSFPNEVGGYIRGVFALRKMDRSQEADDLLQTASTKFPDSLDVNLLTLESLLDASINPTIWPVWEKCKALDGQQNPHFFTLTWRVYLAEQGNAEAIKAIQSLLTEPILNDPNAVPSIIRGLGWLLQTNDKRYAAVRQDIARCLSDCASHDGPRSIPAILRALLGLEPAKQALFEFTSSWLAARHSKLTRVLFSSFESLQQRAAGIESGIRDSLSDVLSSMLNRVETNTHPLSAFEAYNALFLSYVNATAIYSRLVVTLKPLAEERSQNDQQKEIWRAVSAICATPRFLQPAAASPNISIGNRKLLRIALCVSGQLRGFQRARRTWDLLGFGDHDVSTFVHVWQNVGRQAMALANEQRGFPKYFVEKYNYLIAQVGLSTLQQRFPSFYAAFRERVDVRKEELEDCYDTKDICIEDDEQPNFKNMTNAMKMYYKVQAAHEMAMAKGDVFDLIIRLRPDKEIAGTRNLDWYDLLAKSVSERRIFCDYSPVITATGHLLVGDQFAAGCPAVMDLYAHSWSFTERSGRDLYGFQKGYIGHTNFAHTLFYQGVSPCGVPEIEFGSLFDPAGLSLERLLILARQDCGLTPRDDIDRLFLGAFDSDDESIAESETTPSKI